MYVCVITPGDNRVMKQNFVLVLTVLALLSGGIPVFQTAQADPGFPPPGEYLTIFSEHFELHYPQALDQSQATSLIGRFETVHSVLSQAIPWVPENRCQVFLDDASDNLRGWAAIDPRNTINISLAAMESGTPCPLIGDVVIQMFIHEYAHILSMDMRTGIRKRASHVFGRPGFQGKDGISLLFNYLFVLPTYDLTNVWHSEAIAVFAETAFTRGGRGRNNYYQMQARMATLSGKLPAIDQLNLAYDQWPFVDASYFYGYQLCRHIEENYQKPGDDELLYGQTFLAGSHALPFFVNNGPKKVMDKDFPTLMDEAIDFMKQRQHPKIATLQHTPLTECPVFTAPSCLVGRPVIDPVNPDIAYVLLMPVDGRERICKIHLPEDGTRQTRMDTLDADTGGYLLSITADGKYLYYSKSCQYRKNGNYLDLYRYNLQSNESERLTYGARIRAASISPDGSYLTFIRSVLGKQTLWIVPVDVMESGFFDDKPTVLFPEQWENHARCIETPVENTAFFDPQFSPDGSKLVYIKTLPDASSILMLYSLEQNSYHPLLESDNLILQPSFTKDSTGILYVSDRTGVFNTYRLDTASPTHSSVPVSNVMGGVFNPADDGRGNIVCAGYKENGFFLTRFHAGPLSEDSVPVIGGDWNEDLTRVDLVNVPVPVSVSQPDAPRKYSPYRYYLPDFWLPTGMSGEQYGEIGIFTGATDALNFANWQLQAGAGILAADPDVPDDKVRFTGLQGNLHIAFNRFRGDLTMDVSRALSIHSDLLEGPDDAHFDFAEQRNSIRLTYTVPFSTTETVYGWMISGGVHSWKECPQGAERYRHVQLIDNSPFTGSFGSIQAGAYLDTSTRFTHSIIPEDGWRFEALLENQFGSVERILYSASVDRFQSMNRLGLRNTVLQLHVEGGGSIGENILQSAWELGGESGMVPLRGYPMNEFRGQNYAQGQVSLHLPVWNIFRGIRTSPVFVKSLALEIFHDAGIAYDAADQFKDSANYIQSTGLELQLHGALIERIPAEIGVGYAYAYDRPENERHQVYFKLKVL